MRNVKILILEDDLEDGVYNADGVASFAYKMLQSKIKEVYEPEWDWFYD